MSKTTQPSKLLGTDIDLWETLAVAVGAIFSIILLFGFIKVGNFSIGATISILIKWIVGIVILLFGAILVGGLNTKFKVKFGLEQPEIWETLALAITSIVTIIMWFTWLGNNYFEMGNLYSETGQLLSYGIIEIAVSWIVMAVVINFGALLIGWLSSKFKAFWLR